MTKAHASRAFRHALDAVEDIAVSRFGGSPLTSPSRRFVGEHQQETAVTHANASLWPVIWGLLTRYPAED